MKLLQVGFGKAGKHMAHLFYSMGFDVEIALRNFDESIVNLYEGYSFIKFCDISTYYDVVLIATSDSSIRAVSDRLSKMVRADYVIHLSGALSINELSSFLAVDSDVIIMSLHPNIAFSSELIDEFWYKSVYFGLTASSDRAHDFVSKNIITNSEKIVLIADEDKPSYHAAAVLSSNLIMPILQSAINIYESIGVEESSARKLTCSLASSAVLNLSSASLKEVITGPISRKDYDTVERHLLNLNGDEKVVYKTTSNWLKKLI